MKKKQPTVADVLHHAADNCLAYDKRYTDYGFKDKFSCCAVSQAVYEMLGNDYSCKALSRSLKRRVMAGLEAMGCDTCAQNLFSKYGDKPNSFSSINTKVQGMRYMWLKWAALMAEEQGV